MKSFCLALAVILALVPAHAAVAQAVVVQSGDHDGFTRLVLEYGGPVEWSFGRTPDGYELRVKKTPPAYDLSQVYSLIQRNRLSAVWVDPENGNLSLGIGCPCHAIPFEFRPGVLVIDVRDGPPPKGSSFESTLTGAIQPVLVEENMPHPRPRARPAGALATPYDWKTAALAVPDQHAGLPVLLKNMDLLPMRDDLLREMSEGAARGTVEMIAPKRLDPTDGPTGALRQIRIGEDIGFAAGAERQESKGLTPDGADCLTDDRLDIASWGDETPIADQMAPARDGLMGEFDHPDPVAVKRAVQFYLFLGFGAEASQLLHQLPTDDPDQAIAAAMAQILDNGSGPLGPFDGMQSCDTAAAFWAAFAESVSAVGEKPHSAAVLRTFSGLPLHLRRYLGPILSEKMLAQGDTNSARAIRDSILRAPGVPSPEIRLMAAELEIASGEVATGSDDLHSLSVEAGPAATKALIGYVEAQVKAGEPVEANMITTLESLIFENRGSTLEPDLRRAHVLALALNGNFDAAFLKLADAPKARDALWSILASLGTDDSVLLHAVLADIQVPLATRRTLAARLNGLGLPDPAQQWLSDIVIDVVAASDEDRVLAAQIAMQRRDLQTAVRLVAGLGGAEAITIRAKAQAQMGDHASAAGLFNALGNAEEELRSARLAQEWQTVSQEAAGGWHDAAGLLVRPARDATSVSAAEPDGPLARTKQLLAETATARATLSSFLTQVPRAAPAVTQ